MPCGPTCACHAEPGLECLSVVDPARFGYFTEWCQSTDETKRRHVLNRSRIAVGQPLPSEPLPIPTPPSDPQNMGLMLAGDVVEAVAKRIGADRLAKWLEAKTGVNCGCASRKEALNRASEKLLRWAKLKP
jgi:hypothetical protein